jgi:hypothetical protein
MSCCHYRCRCPTASLWCTSSIKKCAPYRRMTQSSRSVASGWAKRYESWCGDLAWCVLHIMGVCRLLLCVGVVRDRYWTTDVCLM